MEASTGKSIFCTSTSASANDRLLASACKLGKGIHMLQLQLIIVLFFSQLGI